MTCRIWWFVGNNFLPILLKISFHMKKKVTHRARNLQIIKALLTLELSQDSKRGSIFTSSELVAASSNCSRLGNSLCLCLPLLPVHPAQALLELGPKSLAIDFAVKTFDCLLDWPLAVIARWPAGAWSWTQTWTLQPEQWVVEIWSALKPQNNLCGVRIIFRSDTTAEIEDSSESISTLTCQTDVIDQIIDDFPDQLISPQLCLLYNILSLWKPGLKPEFKPKLRAYSKPETPKVLTQCYFWLVLWMSKWSNSIKSR